MNIKNLLKRIIDPNHYSSEAYIQYLRNSGVHIGEKTIVYAPRHTSIDIQKLHLISIGSYCKITTGVIILAHDYSISVARRVFGEFIGGTAPTKIGDNCFLGMNSIILPGTTIGNNCIVGAGSVVGGKYPDNVVIAGNPARVVCTLDEYYQKRKNRWVDDAKRCALEIYHNTGRLPTIEEMKDGFYWLYAPRTQESVESHKNFFTLTGDDYEDVCKNFLASDPSICLLKISLKTVGLNFYIKKKLQTY